jgi:hypothetical protein
MQISSVHAICSDPHKPLNPCWLGRSKVRLPGTVAERSNACTVFCRSEAGIVGSNPTEGMNVWCVDVFILFLCCPVFRQKPCDELITRPRSPTVCKIIMNLKKRPGPKGAVEPVKKSQIN